MQRLMLVLWLLAWPLLAVALVMPVPSVDLPGGDKLVHLGIFAAMALGAAATTSRLGAYAALLGVTLALGAGLEGLQALVPWRSFELADIRANWLGTFTGGTLGLFWLALRAEPATGDA
jgi:VanZ family protein